MAKASHIQTNLTSGELSPKMFGRVDLSKYENGAETIQNWIVTPYGGAQRTPGTVFAGEVRDSDEAARLIPFQFSTTQTYMLEFNNGKIRFYRNRARVLESTVTITGITQANPGVVTAASHGYSNGDTVYITGVSGMTQVNGKVFRVAGVTANTFQLTADQTGSNVNTTSYTAYTSGGTVARVYEISQPYLAADLPDVAYAQTADVMYLVHEDYLPRKISRTGHTSWTLASVDFATATLTPPFLPLNTTATTMTPSVTTGNGTLTASGSYFATTHVGAFFELHSGFVEVSGYTSATVVNITVVQTLSATTATASWSEGAWSDYQGYPRAVCFYEQRIAYAATTNFPQSVWLSVSEAFEDFDYGSNADDAMMYTIATDQVNAIQWLSPGKVLLMGTSGGPFSLSSGSNSDPLTPTNVIVKLESTYGTAQVLPKKIGNYVYYSQRDERTIRELGYNLDIDSYRALNISILSEHITAGGIVEMAYQQSPNNVLWVVRGDGKMATLTREIDQEVAGWSEQVTDGNYENVAVIAAQTATDGDEVWFVVNRTINGTTKRYVEYLKTFDWGSDDKDAFFVHSGLTYSGAATSTLTGLDHLEGETVDVYGDGVAFDQATVSGGAITTKLSGTTTTVTKAQVGLPYTSTIKTLRTEGGSAIGTSQGMVRRINNVIVRVLKTMQLKVGDTVTQYDQDLASITTDDVEAHHDGGWDTDGQVVIKCDKPVPAHVLAIIQQYTVEDR